jgi:hypothetical protein
MKRIGKRPHRKRGGVGGHISKLSNRLLLSLADCHSKSDFDLKPSSEQFEGNGRI